MSPNLPKPTSPQSASNQANNGQTVFQNDKKSSDQNSSPAGQTAPVKPAAPPTPPIKLGGKNIPVPTSQTSQSANQPGKLNPPTPAAGLPELKQPTAPLPKAEPSNNERDSKLGINPALAPKPVQTLQAPASPGQSEGSAGKPPTTPTPPSPTKLQPAGVKKPFIAQVMAEPKKWLLIGLGVVVGIVLLVMLVGRIFGGSRSSVQTADTTTAPTKQVILTYWGLWEPSATLEQVIADYETANPGVKIDYRVQSHKDYRERLQTAIASGNGPDMFRYHASWAPMILQELAVLPASVMSANEFQNTFYPVTNDQLVVNGQIVGIPVMYDGLALYYNKEILQTAGVEPPTTWAELKQLADELTVPADKNDRANNGIQRAGLAIGNTSNVDHFSDILGLLILQNGGDPADPASAEVRDALIFYTNFITEDEVWSSSLPNSTAAFARGDVAMMFAPSWRAHEIMELNPSLQFGVAPLPQLSAETVTWANYWAEGVNDKSANKTEAWKFLKYLSSSEVEQKLYSSQSQVRAFGEPYSRQDLAADLADDPYVGAYLSDAPSATGWYMSSATHDNGLNDNIINYYATAVNAVLGGTDVEEALNSLAKGVQQELRQYGLVSAQ